MKSIYLIGSLRNPDVPVVAQGMRKWGLDVFDDWYAAGPEADDKWMEYEQARGRTYREALGGYAARHVYHYDRSHLDRCDGAVLLLPAGKSGHLELGYMAGQGKPTFILVPENVERWDVMYSFSVVCTGPEALKGEMKRAGLLGEQLPEPETDDGSKVGVGGIRYNGVQWLVGAGAGRPRLRSA